MTKKLNYLIAILLILFNLVFFLPGTYELIRTGGGPWGFGLLVLPVTIVGNLYLIPSSLSFLNKYKQSRVLLGINISGIIGSIFWVTIFLTTPK
jgi:hypothetical protein